MQKLFLKHSAAPALSGLVMAFLIAMALFSAGAFSPTELPRSFSNYQQLLGANLLLTLIPAYMVFAWGLLTRRSLVLLQQVDALIDEPIYATRVRTPFGLMFAGAAFGGVYAVVFNLPVESLEQLLAGGPLLICLVFFMIWVWLAVGVVLFSRLYVARLFRQAGRQVPIDPYDQSPLEPFARSGMSDVLMTMGVLVLTMVQSIDATFRPENYLFSLLVGIPAGLTLLFLPMSTLHSRLKALKAQERTEVNAMIRVAPKSFVRDEMVTLEAALQRRERIQDIPTWPLNVSMISRLLFYVVIPPAAWTGAALMERFVEGLLGG
jgi:hypothetical protein